MSPNSIVENALQRNAQSLLENELFPHWDLMGQPALTIQAQDVGYAEYHDENKDIIFFYVDLFWDKPQSPLISWSGRLTVRLSGQARKMGDLWDLQITGVDDVSINPVN